MKSKEIILLVVIILAGVTITLFHSGRLSFLEWDWQPFIIEGEEFSFEEVRLVEPPLPASLLVNNPKGEVIVEKGEGEKVEIFWEKRVWAKKEEEAKTLAEAIKLVLNKTAAEVTIDISTPEKMRRRYQSYLRIIAPAPLTVEISNSYGQVRVGGLSSVKATNSHGSIVLNKIPGPLQVQNRHGDINLTEAGGPAEINCEHGNLALFQVQKEVRIEARHSHLDLDELGAQLEVKAEHVSIRGRKIAGPLSIFTSYEPVDLKEVGEAEIVNKYGLIRIEGGQGHLDLQNRYGTVDLTDIEGNVQITGKNVRVGGRSLKGQEINIDSSYDNIELQDFSGRTTISLRHGDCSLEPASLSAGLNFQGDYSSLRLFWPPRGNYPIEIIVHHGKIIWQLDEPATQVERNSQTEIRAFYQENEAPLVRINNRFGRVVVEKSIAREADKKPISP